MTYGGAAASLWRRCASCRGGGNMLNKAGQQYRVVCFPRQERTGWCGSIFKRINRAGTMSSGGHTWFFFFSRTDAEKKLFTFAYILFWLISKSFLSARACMLRTAKAWRPPHGGLL